MDTTNTSQQPDIETPPAMLYRAYRLAALLSESFQLGELRSFKVELCSETP